MKLKLRTFFALAAAATALSLGGCATSPRALTEGEKLRAARASDPEHAAERERLRLSFQRMVRGAFPEFNGIMVGVNPRMFPREGGFSIVAFHPYFSRYTSALGAPPRRVAAWVSEHKTALRAAGIRDVSLGSTGYGGNSTISVSE